MGASVKEASGTQWTDKQTNTMRSVRFMECHSSLESLDGCVLRETLQSQKGERCIRHPDETLGAAKFTYTEHRMMLQGIQKAEKRQGIS